MNKYAKRVLLSLALGVVFALVDVAITGTMDAEAWNISGPFFWYMFLSRAPIGFFVGLVGVVTVHPILPVIHMRYLRGIGVGVLLSLGLAASAFYDASTTWSTFFMIVGLGAVYGLLIDIIATKVVGDGKDMLAYEE